MRPLKHNLIGNQATLHRPHKAALYALAMDSLSKRILDARVRAGLTLDQVGAHFGISAQAAHAWEKGGKPGLDRLVPLADLLKVSLDHLLRGVAIDTEMSAVRYDKKRFAPILSRVAAGKWNEVYTSDNIPDGTVFLELFERPIGDAIALELDGDSMLPEFRSGDFIVIDTGLEPVPGDFVVAILENEAATTFKKYRVNGYDTEGKPIIDLVPLNTDWPILTLSKERPGRILGTMIEHRRVRGYPRRRPSRNP